MAKDKEESKAGKRLRRRVEGREGVRVAVHAK